MTLHQETRDFDNEEIKGKRYITFSENREFGYVNVIEKVMHLKEPFKPHTLRTREMLGRRFIRDGTRGFNTDFEVDIIKTEKVFFVNLTEEFCKADLATNNPPVTRSYKKDLYEILGFMHPKFFPSVLYINYLQPVIKNRQVNLITGEVMGRRF